MQRLSPSEMTVALNRKGASRRRLRADDDEDLGDLD
jgi:hypothetical protein